MSTNLFVPLYFILGLIVGILVTFSCIKVAMLLPMINPMPHQSNKIQGKKEQPTKKRWDPRSLIPPHEFQSQPTIDRSIQYDSVADLLDPIDPSPSKK
jgi:hypothetical protein